MRVFLECWVGGREFVDSLRVVLGGLGWEEVGCEFDADLVVRNHAVPRGGGLSWKRGYINGWYYFESGGYSAWSSFNYNGSLSLNYLRKYRLVSRSYIARRQTKCDQPRVGDFDFLDSSWVFLATQRSDDSVACFTKWDWHVLLYKLYDVVRGSGVKLAIKRHPGCSDSRVTKQLRRLDSLPNVRVFNANIHHVLQRVGAVVVSNSGVGFEAGLYGKPVYVLGRSDYESAAIKIGLSDIVDLPRWTDHHRINQSYVIGAMLSNSLVHVYDYKRIEKILVGFAKKKLGHKF